MGKHIPSHRLPTRPKPESSCGLLGCYCESESVLGAFSIVIDVLSIWQICFLSKATYSAVNVFMFPWESNLDVLMSFYV